jgi:hypothetical protein
MSITASNKIKTTPFFLDNRLIALSYNDMILIKVFCQVLQLKDHLLYKLNEVVWLSRFSLPYYCCTPYLIPEPYILQGISFVLSRMKCSFKNEVFNQA